MVATAKLLIFRPRLPNCINCEPASESDLDLSEIQLNINIIDPDEDSSVITLPVTSSWVLNSSTTVLAWLLISSHNKHCQTVSIILFQPTMLWEVSILSLTPI